MPLLSIDGAKREAKLLKRSLNAAHVDATLSQPQTALARLHGYSDWDEFVIGIEANAAGVPGRLVSTGVLEEIFRIIPEMAQEILASSHMIDEKT